MKKLFLLLLAFFAFTAPARATDVTIGPSTIPNFNAANLAADVAVSPVTVTFNSPAVTCSSCFRQQWVGMGGFRIAINGVAYTVAYVSSRSSLTLTTNYAGGDSSGASILWYKYVVLRIYADSSFQPLGKTYIVQPGAPNSGAWHRQVAASVVNEFGNNNLYIPQLVLDATTDSLTNQAARYYAAFYRAEGGFIQGYDCFDSFSLAPTGATTWPDICVANSRQVFVQDNSTYTKAQVDAMRTGCTTGQSLYYAVTGLKPDCLIIGTGLQITGNTLSATAGSSYQTILNNGTPLTQRTALNFLAPAFVASDNGGGARTDVTAHGNLVALANLASNGGVFRTGANTFALRTLTGTTNRIVVTNGDGVAGPPTFDIGSSVATSANNLSFFASTTSAQLAGLISNETGSGALVFGTSPTVATPAVTGGTFSGGTFTSPQISANFLDVGGNVLIDVTATASAINRLGIANAASGNNPTISTTASGGANVGIDFTLKGNSRASFNRGIAIAHDDSVGNSPRLQINNTTATRELTSFVNNSGSWVQNSTGQGDITTTNMTTREMTFSVIPQLPASNPTTANQAVRKQALDDTTLAWSIGFFEADPSTSITASEDRAKWIAPDGASITVTKIAIVFGAGSHTSGGSLTYGIRKRNSSGGGSVDLGNLLLDNTNNTVNVVYTNDISDLPISPGDTLTFFLNARSGTISERSVSISIIGTQKRIP